MVPGQPPLELAISHKTIRQGYLVVDDVGKSSARIRQWGYGCYTMAVKSGVGIAREETEVEITEAQFNLLWPLTVNARLEKVRYLIPYAPYFIELDVFEYPLFLVLAEVEFKSIEQAKAFKPPAWCGEDVTPEEKFTNAWIARYGNPLGATKT